MKRKQLQRDLIRQRASEALKALYHNATPTYPSELYGRTDDYFHDWFNDAASTEIEYLQDGGAYGKDYRATLAAPCNAGRYHSEAARDYYIRAGMRKMHSERDNCGAITGWKVLELAVTGKQRPRVSYGTVSGEAQRNNARWEYISEYGALYTYGRGGRTLAPDDLWTSDGCGRGCKVDTADLSIDECMRLIYVLESFNAYVAAWCKGVPEMWREHCEYETAEDNVRAIREAYELARDSFACDAAAWAPFVGVEARV